MASLTMIVNLMQRSRDILHNLPAAWRWCLPAWLFSRVGLSLWGSALGAIGLRPFGERGAYYFDIAPYQGPLGALLEVWQRWDGLNYQRIVENGYSGDDLTAFFPLYPLLARGLRALTGMDSLAALVAVSSLCFLLALVTLYRLVELDYSPATARAVVAATALFPTAFFFHAPYPQALGLLLALLAALAARQGRWLTAAGAGLLTGLTHSTGVPLALLLAWEAWKTSRIKPQQRALPWLAHLAVAATPLLGTGLFLAWRLRMGFPAFGLVQAVIWKRVFQWPWQALGDIPEIFIYGWGETSGWCDLALLLLAVATALNGWRWLRGSYWLYAVSLLALLLATGFETHPLASFGRIMLAMFPVYIALGHWIQTRRVRLAAITLALTAQLLLSAMFFLWLWVD